MRWISLFGLIRSTRIIFPDNERIVDQLSALRMTELAAGTLRVEGKGKSKDDVADAICLAAWRALTLQPSGGSVEMVRTPLRHFTGGMSGGQRKWFRTLADGRRVPMTPPVGTPEHKAYAERCRAEGISTAALEKYWAAQGGNGD
jgi:hypothetical protein